jgi:hypothetical protein
MGNNRAAACGFFHGSDYLLAWDPALKSILQVKHWNQALLKRPGSPESSCQFFSHERDATRYRFHFSGMSLCPSLWTHVSFISNLASVPKKYCSFGDHVSPEPTSRGIPLHLLSSSLMEGNPLLVYHRSRFWYLLLLLYR